MMTRNDFSILEGAKPFREHFGRDAWHLPFQFTKSGVPIFMQSAQDINGPWTGYNTKQRV